jgi:uncharacterized membrane protein YczE
MTTLADLGPLAQLRAGRLARRIPQLLVGLVLYGVSLGLMVRGALGLAPWTVLDSGLIRFVPVDLGDMVVIVSVLVLAAWLPLREKPGVGTIANTLILGPSADLTMAVLHQPSSLGLRMLLTVGGIALCGLATALYIGAQFGRGPRDGLMTGIARRTGWSLRVVRTGLELCVVVLGVALGGSVGLGTLAYAVAIGPLAQRWLPVLTVALDEPVAAPVLSAEPARL